MFSDFELAEMALKKLPGATARDISKYVTEMGVGWDKGHSNSVLYKMLNQGLVRKELTNGPRPHWWLLENPVVVEQEKEITKLVINKKRSKTNEFIPLKHITEYGNKVQGMEIQFAIDNELSSSDPYINCDWLEKRIFVTINGNHPYVKTNISSDKILNEFLTYLSIDAYVEWRIIMELENKGMFNSIDLKDRILRERVDN
jgi:hypothetical protein